MIQMDANLSKSPNVTDAPGVGQPGLLGQPFASDCFKRVRKCCLLGLPLGAGINAIHNHLAHLIPAIACAPQSHIGRGAQAQQLFPALEDL